MNKLIELAEEYGITITSDMVKQFEDYSKFLIEYNEKVNLTAITDPEEIMIKHFLDSILIFSAMEIEEGATVIDVGTGAGFPGVPMKIVRPDIRLTLLDSLNKRIVFLEELTNKLDIQAKLIHGRAEDVGHETPFRDGYTLVVSRAVTRFPALAEYCLPFAKEGGHLVAFKGPDYEEELKESKKAIKLLSAKTKDVYSLKLPDGSERNLICIEKTGETSDKYPRQRVKITKNPIK